MSNSHSPRRGAAAIFVLLLTSLLFIAIVFSVDIARIQLAQLEMQSGTDFASRAGAEALARGVGEGLDDAVADAMIRDEIALIAQLNSAGGEPIVLNTATAIEFGQSNLESDGTYSMNVSAALNRYSDGVSVTTSNPSFPVVFGGFVSQETVGLTQRATAMVTERDIVVVLDRSGSMLKHDAGTMLVSKYNANLRALEDALYGPGEAYYPGGEHYSAELNTEFEEAGGVLNLSRTQALKLAILKFRQQIDLSRCHERLGLASYSLFADTPAQAVSTAEDVDIVNGLTPVVFNSIVGDGITYENEHYASALETEDVGYRNFDYNYLSMRREGWTNIVDGMNKGTDILFGPGRRPFATPVLILMTDGIHNQAGDPLITVQAIMAAHPRLQIYTVTFGSGADEVMLRDIANIGNGLHYHAADVGQLVDIFSDLASLAGVTLVQ